MRLGAPGELWLVEAEELVGEVDTQLHLLHLGVEGRPQKNPSRNASMLSIEALVLQRPRWPVKVREISNGRQLQFCTPVALPGPAMEEPEHKGTLPHCAARVIGFDLSLKLNSLID